MNEVILPGSGRNPRIQRDDHAFDLSPIPKNQPEAGQTPHGIVHALWSEIRRCVVLVMSLHSMVAVCFGQSYGERIWTPPAIGTFYMIPMGGTNSPPYPFLPVDPIEVPVYSLGITNAFLFDGLGSSSSTPEGVPPPPGEGGGGPGVPASVAYDYNPGEFYLTIDDIDTGYAYLTLHGTTNELTYELFSTANLQPSLWIPEQLFLGESNETHLINSRLDRSPLFFMAARGWTDVVSIFAGADAIAPYLTNHPGEIGHFLVQRTNVTATPLTVSYYVGGTASNGCHYVFLSGTVTIPANTNTAIIQVQPITNCFALFVETVTLTLAPSNGYFIDPSAFTATILLENNPRVFQRVVTNLDNPIRIDYHPPTQSLIVTTGSSTFTNNFMRIYTNIVFTNSVHVTNVIVTNWTYLIGIPDEVKLTIVKTTSNGFINGDLYFGDGSEIGWISAYGTNHDRHWGVLTNASMTNTLELRGGLYVDQSGSFDGDLIAVTGNGTPLATSYGIWRVDSGRHSKLIAEISANHLEGVITLSNDVATWGPWAGKVLTGDENGLSPLIFAVATNGTVSSFDMGIRPEDFDIIPVDYDLYCADPDSLDIVKLPRTLLNNYAGSLVITEAGEQTAPAKLFFVQWDGNKFIKRTIFYRHLDRSAGHFEHVTFAPMDIPRIP
jgi:hypothetical protein